VAFGGVHENTLHNQLIHACGELMY